MNKQGAETFDLTADVLVVGGGPAAAWAAIAASEAGARVILVDRVMSAPAAPPRRPTPAPGRRRLASRAAIHARLSRAGGLADPEWIEHTMAWLGTSCTALLIGAIRFRSMITAKSAEGLETGVNRFSGH